MFDDRQKRHELKHFGRNGDEVIDRCVFVCYNHKDSVADIARNGIVVGTSNLNYLGKFAVLAAVRLLLIESSNLCPKLHSFIYCFQNELLPSNELAFVATEISLTA
jgi:hypothetical protein